MTRDELLAWLDDRTGLDVRVETDVDTGGGSASVISIGGVLNQSLGRAGIHTVGASGDSALDAILDVSQLTDGQVEQAKAELRGGRWTLAIPLGGDVTLLVIEGLIESG